MAKEEAETAARQATARQAAARPNETPDDFQTGSRYELEPVQPEQMEVLELIFSSRR